MKIEEALKVVGPWLDDLSAGDATIWDSELLSALRALVETAEAGRWRPITETEPANWQNGARQLAER